MVCVHIPVLRCGTDISGLCRSYFADAVNDDSYLIAALKFKDDYAGAFIDIGYKYGHKFPERPGFQRMLADARNGQIDLIFVYNMERFAQTIDDTLCFTEELRLLPYAVLVMFEMEHSDSDTLHQYLLRFGNPRKRKRRSQIG